MKASDSRELLIGKIENFISTISPAKSKELEQEVMHDGKISTGDFFKMLSGRYPLEEASDAELYWITFAISNVSKRFGTVNDFFEDAEIANYKFYDGATENSNKYSNGIVFKHVQKLAENQYLFPLSVGEIREMKNCNILQIIPELQRNHTKDKYGDLKTKVNKQTAQEISTLINNGEFFFNGIRFNLMDDGESDPPIYDEDAETLTVVNGTIIVPDGNHRSIACELATKHLDDKFGIFFTYLSAPKTRLVLNQEWTTVPIPKRHRDAMKPTPSNKVVDSIMRSHDADELYVKNIVKDGSEIRIGNGFILYIEFSDAISRYYDMSNMQMKADQDELRDWIITFMNYLTKLMKDDFMNFTKVRRKSWAVHYYAIHYFMMIGSKIKGNSEWRTILEKIIKETNFEDEDIRKYCVSNNRRKFYQYCKEKEEAICIMLK